MQNDSELAVELLMNALRVRTPRKVREKQRAMIQAGQCILEGCCDQYESHGLCKKHVNKFHYEFKKIWLKRGQKAAIEYRNRRTREGTYLVNQDQRELARESA